MAEPYEPRLDATLLADVQAAFDADNMKGLPEAKLKKTFRSLLWAWHRVRAYNEAVNWLLASALERELGRNGKKQTLREVHKDRKAELLAEAMLKMADVPGTDSNEVNY